MNNTAAVDVFLGHPLVDATEKHFLARLRRDLSQRGLRARILANLEVGATGLRELDFVIVTECRAVVCELKGYSNPIVAQINGRWKTIANGTVLEMDGNPYRQVLDGGYALSDGMRDFANKSEAPAARKGKFIKDLDLVVCLFPSVPADSEIERHKWVRVVGYEELLAQLTDPGRRPEWGDQDWDAFVRDLGLYRDEEDEEAARAVRVSVSVIDEYCARFVHARQPELDALVPTRVSIDGSPVPRPNLRAGLVNGRDFLLYGSSGQGKTLWAAHTAVEMASAGDVPIWLTAGAYEDDFATHLARGVAPYTTHAASELVAAARTAGRSVLLIVDGLNECPESWRPSLMDGMRAVRLHASNHSILVTTQRPMDLPAGLSPASVELLPPDEAERRAILAAAQAEHVLDALDGFDTPFDLTIAASCVDHISDGAAPVELLDEYVDRVSECEPTRAILRSIAWRMQQELRLSLRTPDVVRTTRRELGVSPEEIDRAFECRLLVVAQGRLSFRHERFARFLAADALLLRCADGSAVARMLNEPRSAPIRGDLVGLESDETRLGDILSGVEDDDLLVAAAEGRLGKLARRVAIGVLVEALRVASAQTASSETRFVPSAAGATLDAWELPSSLTARDFAQLLAAGRCFRRGLLLDEVAHLVEQADALCAAWEAGADGNRAIEPGRAFVATYASGRPVDDIALPAAAVVRGCVEAYFRGGDRSDTSRVARALLERSDTPGPGILYLALNLLRSRPSEALDLLPRLVPASLACPAYHLRLEALELVEQIGRTADLESDVRDALLDAIRGVETDNLLLSSSVVEALASLGDIEPISTLDGITAELADILSRPDDPLAWRKALGAISSQFEEEEIVGPYHEAIESLGVRKRDLLLAMALRASDADDFSTRWVLEEVRNLEEPRLRSAVGDMLSRIDPAGWHSAQWGIASTVLGLRLFAHAGLRPPSTRPTEEIAAWHALIEILNGILREAEGAEQSDEVQTSCRLLITEHRAVAADLLYQLHSARTVMWNDDLDYEAEIVEMLGPQLVDVLVWSLEHPDQLQSPVRWGFEPQRSVYIVELLGQLGDSRAADVLRRFADDPRLGTAAVGAVQEIESR